MLYLALDNLRHVRAERAIALALIVTLFSALGAYGYFIVSSVINVTLRQELMVSIQDTEAKVSELETEYLARTGALNEGNVEDLGLVKLSSVQYTSVADDATRLSLLPQ
jgi:hypothetical protein